MTPTDEPDKTELPLDGAVFEAGREPPDLPEPKGAKEKAPRLLAPSGPRSRRRKTVPADQAEPRAKLTADDRLALLDAWQRSRLSADEFASLTVVSAHSLYTWRRKFEEFGPAGLEDRPRGGPKGSRMPPATRRAVLLMKANHPDWGVDRLHDMLERTAGYKASPGAILRVLKEEGYKVVDVPTRPNPPKKKKAAKFEEREIPNSLWQTDLFTFKLKRENRRVYLVGFLDDHSRFLVGFAIHATSTGTLVRDAFESAVATFGLPEEVLTDQGPQYYTWRGKSQFTKLLEKRGVRHLVSRPKRPQTLGKIERFWGTLWRECIENAVFRGLEDATVRIRHFVNYYNFHRTHRGIKKAVPADRYFAAAPEVKETLEAQVAWNAKELAQNGVPRKPFYLTGRVGDGTLSLHSEGDRVILTNADGSREEVDLKADGLRAEPAPEAPEEKPNELPPPGTSPLDDVLDELAGDAPSDGEE